MKKQPIKVTEVTIEELATIIAAETAPRKITVVLNTEPKMRKTNNPFVGLARKLAKYSVMINFNYENSVNNQRKREDVAEKFTAQARAWGEHETKSIISKDDGLYLQLKHEKTLHESFINTVDNTFINKTEIAPFLQVSKPNPNQGVEKVVRVMSPKFTNIVEVAMNGERFRVKK